MVGQWPIGQLVVGGGEEEQEHRRRARRHRHRHHPSHHRSMVDAMVHPFLLNGSGRSLFTFLLMLD